MMLLTKWDCTERYCRRIPFNIEKGGYPYAYCFTRTLSWGALGLFGLAIWHYGFKITNAGIPTFHFNGWYLGRSPKKGIAKVDKWLKENGYRTMDDPRIALLI